VRLWLGVSVALNVVLWVRLQLARWHAEQDVDSAYRQGRWDGWFDAARHIPVGRARSGDNHLN